MEAGAIIFEYIAIIGKKYESHKQLRIQFTSLLKVYESSKFKDLSIERLKKITEIFDLNDLQRMNEKNLINLSKELI